MTSADPCATGGRVLVIEDNIDAAETMQMLLAISGYDARMAHDAASAIKVASEFSPEVVFCDIGLPGKDGYAVAQELRQLPGTRSSLLIALTGYGRDDDRRRATEAGFDGFQVKPVDPGALEALLAAHFSARAV